MTKYQLSVVVLASNEIISLRQTIQAILLQCPSEDLKEIILFLKSKDCPAAVECEALCYMFPALIKPAFQKGTDLFHSFAEIPALVSGSHFLIIAADMEMDPNSVGTLLKKSKQRPCAIVSTAKWLPESKVDGYGFFHAQGSKWMNRLSSRLLHINAYDLFTVFQIYPVQVYQAMCFSDPLLFPYEFTLKPISKGIEYIEIPTHFVKRAEGKSSATPLFLLRMAIMFLYTAWKLRKQR